MSVLQLGYWGLSWCIFGSFQSVWIMYDVFLFSQYKLVSWDILNDYGRLFETALSQPMFTTLSARECMSSLHSTYCRLHVVLSGHLIKQWKRDNISSLAVAPASDLYNFLRVSQWKPQVFLSLPPFSALFPPKEGGKTQKPDRLRPRV